MFYLYHFVAGNVKGRGRGGIMATGVTHREIDEGAQGNSFHCRVACAIRRAFKASGALGARNHEGGRERTFVTPPQGEVVH